MVTLRFSSNVPHLYEGTLVFLRNECGLRSQTSDVVRVGMEVPVLNNGEWYKCSYGKVSLTVREVLHPKTMVVYQSKVAIQPRHLYVDFASDVSTTFMRDVDAFIRNDCKRAVSGGVVHYVFTDFFEWERSDQYKRREMSTLYLPDRISAGLVADFTRFHRDEAVAGFYDTMGISKTRTYLFYGFPGTGKTTTATVMASEMGLNICTVDFTHRVDDYMFRKCVKTMPENSLLLLEDVDHLVCPRNAKEDHRRSITFSGLLNILDGVTKVDKLVCVITCNDISVLDKALLRRIDYSVEFEHCVTECQLRKMFARVPFSVDLNKVVTFFKSKTTTVNIIQKWLLTNLDALMCGGGSSLEDLLGGFEEFNKWYHKAFSQNGGHMYS